MRFLRGVQKDYLIVLVMSVSVVFSGSLIAPIEQRFISSLTKDTPLMGFVFTMGTLSIALISLIFARLSKKYGKNKLIIIGAALGIIYPLIYATSTNIFQYIGGKIIFGISGAAMGPLLAAYLQECLFTSENKGKALGYLYSLQSVAGSAGAIFGGILADKYSLGFPYYVQAMILAIPFILAVKFMKREETKVNSPTTDYFFIIKYIFSNPYLVYHLILEIPFKMNWAVKVVLYPLVIISFVDSNTITGSVFATQGVVAMGVLFFAGNFVDRYSYMTGMKSAFLVLAIASLLMALSWDLATFWIFAALFAVGEAISGPSKGVLEIKNIENQYRAEVLAVFSTAGYFIEAVSPLLAGILLLSLDSKTVLMVYSFMIWFFLVAATIILRMNLKSLDKKLPTQGW